MSYPSQRDKALQETKLRQVVNCHILNSGWASQVLQLNNPQIGREKTDQKHEQNSTTTIWAAIMKTIQNGNWPAES